MLDKEIEKRLAEYPKYSRKPLIETDRKPLPLMKYPKDLDFSKTVGNTTYVVKSHFNKNANESLLLIISRLLEDGKSLSE